MADPGASKIVICRTASAMPATASLRHCLRQLARAMWATRRLDGNSRGTGWAFLGDRLFCSWLPEFINRTNEQKNRARNNEEIDGQSNEVAVIPSDRSGFGGISGRVEHRRAIFGRSQNDKLVGKIQSAGQQANWRHDYIFDQRIDDRTKRGPDNHADVKIDCVALDGEFLEFLPYRFHITMLTSFLGTTITLRTVLPAIRS